MSVDVPNLPGFRRNPQVARPRAQGIAGAGPRPGEPVIDYVALRAEKARAAGARPSGDAAARKAAVASTAVRVAPAVAHEKQVLRFFAYFKEAVAESPVESERVRKITIQLFLEDMTIQALEPRDENSGLPQGTLIKRHAIPRSAPDGGTYDWRDLVVGNEVTFYGRTMRIVDCDVFTRSFYEGRGFEMPPAEEYPVDAATERLAAMPRGGGETGAHGKKVNPMKKFMEATLGRKIADPEALRRFLDNDRKVLRFDCYWDDTGSLYGDKNAFTLNYYLSDDTVSVNEVLIANSGKDHFPTLLKRSKLPRDWKVGKEVEDASRGVELMDVAEHFVSAADLAVGGTVSVYGRTLNISACDPFTRQYYAEVLGIEQAPDAPLAEVVETKRVFVPPPSTGFGDEEDSLSACKSLIPKPPKKDFNKFMRHATEVYRFSARLHDPSPEDAAREFLIQFYPSDDTLSIFEPPVRNSGIGGGKFLNRGKFKQVSGEPFTPEVFVPGTTVEIAKHGFDIIDIDEFTRRALASDVAAAHASADAAAE